MRRGSCRANWPGGVNHMIDLDHYTTLTCSSRGRAGAQTQPHTVAGMAVPFSIHCVARKLKSTRGSTGDSVGSIGRGEKVLRPDSPFELRIACEIAFDWLWEGCSRATKGSNPKLGHHAHMVQDTYSVYVQVIVLDSFFIPDTPFSRLKQGACAAANTSPDSARY